MSTDATTIRTAARIRQDFLDFFREKHAHVHEPSSPVVPHDDPTLLFTNAGMNQFKDVFLGQGSRPYTRAVNSQKCIRAGGKHNDLEDVGKDGYHHTFFEMLGNWSFGDYFKAEAIAWAWELLTSPDWWGLDPDRLYVSVFAGDAADGLEPDTEAEEIWTQFVPRDRISRWGRKDNFWEMGETGPCGPCSEIHYDGRSDAERREVPGSSLINRDHPDVIELWNLVFIQFDRAPGEGTVRGALTPLPARHVDTGMGLERLVRFLQGRQSNYDTDLWTPIFRAIEAHTGAHPYGGRLDDPVDEAYRVIADHIRCLVVSLTDGARAGSEGRGYVLRRILRRAVRHAHQTLATTGAWLFELVPAVVESLADAFPELRTNPAHVAEIIRDEEESFLRTLDRGIALFDDAASRAEAAGATVLDAGDAFRLHDTFGFPIDLTRVMAEERGLGVDEAGYERLMTQARETSRRGGATETTLTLPADALGRLRRLDVEPTRDGDKYRAEPVTTQVRAIWSGRDLDDAAAVGDQVAVILDRTNHYAESGGQVGDTGRLTPTAAPGADDRFDVEDTRAVGGYVMHLGRLRGGRLRVGDEVRVTVDRDRRGPTAANHTATHLLNHALREVIGDDVDQKGSLVAPERLRFDFSCPHAMSAEQIERTEKLVNEAIARALAVHAEIVPLAEARRIHGLRAVFGEVYPDPVRVVSIGPSVAELLAEPGSPRWRAFSVELCGGTHLAGTSEARRFVVAHEQALASGVRRVVALTGSAAEAADVAGRDLETSVAAAEGLDGEPLVSAFDELNRLVDEITVGAVVRTRVRQRLDAMRDRIKAIRKSAQSQSRSGAVDQARVIADRGPDDDGVPVIVEAIAGADKDGLMAAIDVLQSRCPQAGVMLFAVDEAAERVAIIAVVPKTVIQDGLKAGDWVREAARVCGGGGGGRPDMAQAGGKDPSKVAEAVVAAREFARKVLT